MAEYIDTKYIGDCDTCRHYFDGLGCGIAYCDHGESYSPDMSKIPTADVVEVRHGEWISKDCISKSKRGRTIHYSTYKCSVCEKWNGRHKENYCSNCGAKMDGGKTE